MTKIAKGLSEFEKVGLIPDPATKICGAQPEGCSPVAAAFAAGSADVQPVKPSSIAKSLAIGNPADGYYALKEVRATGGAIAAVPEQDVVEGIRLLARTEGIFTEPAGGVTISGLERLVRAGAIHRNDETVALITGLGLKTVEALGATEPTHVVPPHIERVEEVL